MDDKDNPHATSLANIRKGIKKRNDSKVVSLPHWVDTKRGTPNSFIRSALFAAIHAKDRQSFKKMTLLASQDGVTVKFMGQQLNQSDLDVWEALIHLAREQQLGNCCEFTAYEILKTLGLPVGNSQYKYLEETIARLTACAVRIDHDEYIYFGSLVHSTRIHKETRYYEVDFNKDMANLFSENKWTAIDWEERRLLQNKPLAQSLHAFYSSHQKPYPLKLETLHAYTGSRNGQKASFKRQIKKALEILKSIGFLSSYRIDRELVHVVRTAPKIIENE